MAIQGLRDTSNFVANQRPLNWRAGILMLFPNGKAPLTGLTAAMKSRSVDDPEYNWWEKALETRRLQISSDITNAVTAIPVSAGAQSLKKGDLVYQEETGEIMHVTADPSSDTSIGAVTRGASGTTAASVTVASQNPFLVVIGSAYEEASLAPTGVNFDPTKVRNYTQIFRNTLEMSRTAQKTRLRTGDQVKEAKRECLQYHSIDMERAFWFGQAFEGTVSGKPWRTSGGIMSFIPGSNVSDRSAGSTTMLQLEEDLYNMFKFGSSEKMGWCGNRALLTINQIVRKNGHMNIQSGIKEFGMNVSRLTCPFGELVLKTHPLFNQMLDGAGYQGMESSIVALDMDNIGYTHLTDSDTKWQPDMQENGLDGMKAGYLTEAGMEVHHASTHYHIKGLISAAADA